MAKKKQTSIFAGVMFSIIALVIGFAGGFAGFAYLNFPNPHVHSDTYTSGEVEIHFLELGNKYTGDSTYIKAGDVDILIDAGSRAGSVGAISSYLNEHVTDGKLEYVIVTHADQDHIAGFGTGVNTDSIFDLYEVDTIIDFPKTNKNTQVYNNYVRERGDAVTRGAKHYTALECWNESNGAQKVYDLGSGIELEILYNYYYENATSDENDYSVCFIINQGSKHFLFTGDLESHGETYLVEYNNLPQVELFKAGHHGSPTSSNDVLLNVIQPKICVACCCAGSTEYTENMANTFPSQAFINRIAKHTDAVYVTTLSVPGIDGESDTFASMNGNVVVKSSMLGVTVDGSNNSTKLKDTDWFANNRTTPTQWA